MKIVCLTCGMESEDKKKFFELTGTLRPKFICKDCAAEIGINNFMRAGLTSNINALKKYAKIHPEAQVKLEQLKKEYLEKSKEELQKSKEDFKKSIEDMAELKNSLAKKKQRSRLKKNQQTQCTCCSCGNVFYFGAFEVLKNVTNITNGSLYSLNQLKDFTQCPKCGSRAITKKEIAFWVDKDGNCVEIEE